MQTVGKDSAVIDERGVLVNEFFRNFGSLIQSYKLYPKGSDSMTQIFADFRTTLDKCFVWRPMISLSILRERMYFEEYLIKSYLSLATRIVDAMLDRLIRRVDILKGVDDAEIWTLVEILNANPIQIRDEGGPESFLADRGAHKVSIFELAMFTSDAQEIYDANSWQNALQKAGLDVDNVTLFLQGPDRPGFLVDLDKSGRMSVRGHRMSRHELSQLVELLLNPKVLAQMILDLASVATKDGPMIDPSEIIRIMTRTENTVLFRSNYPVESVKEKLGAALRLIDPNIRTAILTESIRRRAQGLTIPNIDLFCFTPEEWSAALYNLCVKTQDDQYLRQVKFTEAEWLKIKPYLHRMWREKPPPSFEPTKISERLLHFRLKPERFQQPAADVQDLAGKVSVIGRHETAKRKLTDLKSNLQKQIEIGYVGTVLGLLQAHSEDARLHQIVGNFFEQIHQLVEREHSEAVRFLEHFDKVMNAKEDKSQKLIQDWLQRDGKDFLLKITDVLSSSKNENNRSAMKKILPLLKKSGKESIGYFLDQCYFKDRNAAVPPILEIISEIREDVEEILIEILDEKGSSFSPQKFFKALGLLLALKGKEAEPLIRTLLGSPKPSVRMGTMLCLIYHRDGALTVPIFREIAYGVRASDFSPDEQIIAIYGLGEFRDEQSLPELMKTAEHPKDSSKAFSADLNLAVLHAIARIKREGIRKDIPRLLEKARNEGFLSRLIPWKKASAKKEGRA